MRNNSKVSWRSHLKPVVYGVIYVVIPGLVLGLTGCDKLQSYVGLWEKDTPSYELATQEELVESLETEISSESVMICVHVAGEVQKPGVYCLPQGSRVYEAIQAAGGFTSEAVQEGINQARLLADGEQLMVWNSEQVAQGLPESKTETEGSKRININTADKESLMTLPGIGEAKAQEILDWRASHGAFLAIEDIMNVPGIKEYAFQKMKEYITVQ